MTYEINYPGEQYISFKYPAGEIQVRLKLETIKAVRKADEIRVWATIRDGNFMELLLLMDAINGLQTFKQKITLILPYLPYGRADRRFLEGDCSGLSTIGRILNYATQDRIVTLDAHSNKSWAYVENIINIDPLSFIKQAVDTIGGDLTILLPDAGAKRYKLDSLGLPVLQCEKKRNPETGQLLSFGVPSDIKTKKILIVDDICDGGGTFAGIADQLDWFYPLNLKKYLYVTHGIFSKGTAALHMFDRIFTTDSFYEYTAMKLTVFPVKLVIDKFLSETV